MTVGNLTAIVLALCAVASSFFIPVLTRRQAKRKAERDAINPTFQALNLTLKEDAADLRLQLTQQKHDHNVEIKRLREDHQTELDELRRKLKYCQGEVDRLNSVLTRFTYPPGSAGTPGA